MNDDSGKTPQPIPNAFDHSVTPWYTTPGLRSRFLFAAATSAFYSSLLGQVFVDFISDGSLIGAFREPMSFWVVVTFFLMSFVGQLTCGNIITKREPLETLELTFKALIWKATCLVFVCMFALVVVGIGDFEFYICCGSIMFPIFASAYISFGAFLTSFQIFVSTIKK